MYAFPSAGATRDTSWIATIASSFVRLCPVDQFVNAMFAFETIGMTTNATRKTTPGARYLSGTTFLLGER